MKSYKYSLGNLLEKPNTYFYSEYTGLNFIESWIQSRKYALRKFNLLRTGLLQDQKCRYLFGNPVLNELLKQAKDYKKADMLPKKIELLLQRFEVTKKIYNTYSHEMRAVDGSTYTTLDNYVLAALIFEVVYSKTLDIRFFNALLKIMDIICSDTFDIDSDLSLICTDLLSKEMSHFSKLCENFK